MKYFVNRQCYWPEGTLTVEIAVGGIDYANADMLGERYKSLGEGREFTDPREAAEAAILVYEAWKLAKPDEEIEIAYGCTGGFTMPFEGTTVENVRAWAEQAYAKLDKCAECNELLGKTKYGDPHLGEFDCCSEFCAEKRYLLNEEDEPLDDDEDEEEHEQP